MAKISRVTLSGLASLATLALAAGCGGSSGGRSIADDDPAPGVKPTAKASGSPTARKEDNTPYSVTVKASGAEVRTKGSGTNECVEITATVKKGTAVSSGVEVDFKSAVKYGEGEIGRVGEETVKTDEKGVATTSYCGGDKEGAAVVTAKAGASSANTGEIKTTNVPVFRFSYKDPKAKSHSLRVREAKSDVDKFRDVLTEVVEDTDKKDPIALSLNGGGSDCALVEFELTKNGGAVSGEKITFQSQEDFPLGVKLARREGVGATKINPVTGKRYALVEVESNIEGVFQVPVCAGALPGYVILSATYADSTGKTHQVRSPLISMKGGLTNYGYFSLTYDKVNSRVAPADTFTNSTIDLKFIANLGTRNDGSIIKTFPLNVLTEIGRAVVDANGFPDDKGQVKFSYEVLNTRGRRPFRVNPSLPDLDANYVACDPLAFTTRTPYSTLAENWRSTMVYYVKGNEYFNDSNQNGVFDKAQGDGFWDRNENGQFDSGVDVITYDWKGDSAFDPVSEWFIDLPSPFVDANENMTYDPGEVLVGDAYVKPNGEWDDNTFLWKSSKVPVYLGATAYSVNHSAISSTINDFSPSQGWRDYHAFLHNNFANTPYGSNIANSDTARRDQLFSVGSTLSGPVLNVPVTASTDYEQWYYFHMQDKCGNPLPGGAKITLEYTVEGKPAFGERLARGSFYVQPMDAIREKSKRLLSKSDGSSEAEVNFDTLEHPASRASYPIEFKVTAARCLNQCTGDLHVSVAANPPYYCDAQWGYMHMNVNSEISVKHAVVYQLYWEQTRGGVVTNANKCGCVSGASNKGGV